jgi:DNA-binding transcriptional LysR family regulator
MRPTPLISRVDVEMMDICLMNFDSLDLNLLRVLEALLAERSVSRAAARLRLSQPATSSALARLREALHDPLLVRGGGGMVPTPRALALQEPVRAALRQLEGALTEPAAFEPRTARQTFVLVASDHAQLLVVPGLAARLRELPHLRLRVLAPPRDFPLAELERGEVDLVLGAFDLAPGDRAPRGLKRQLLATERFVVVGRRGHPALARGRRLELTLPQLHVAPRGGTEGRFDRQVRLRRNVVLFVPHYLVAPWVLASTDLLAALPERVARRFAEAFPLTLAPAPVEGAELRLHQLWHPRRQEEPAHRWLRAEVLAAARP